MKNCNFNHFANKTVLVTGHTGFKGSWLAAWLSLLGARVVGVSDAVPTVPSNFIAVGGESFTDDNRFEISDFDRLKVLISDQQPDFVFHLAAQPIVHEAYENPLSTVRTNVMGTAAVLEALRITNIACTCVIITSDKVYDNLEWCWGYRETDKLGGKDPYSASKGMAELLVRSYAQSYFNGSASKVKVAVCRAGNVIGGGDWAPSRIVPDCIRAWSDGLVANIRSPKSTRPWQHVLEPIRGYLMLACQLSVNSELNAETFNFGPPNDQNHSVQELLMELGHSWPDAQWSDVSLQNAAHQEARLLKLNCDKAASQLGWMPVLTFNDTVRLTAEWYKNYYSKKIDCLKFTKMQIDYYTSLL